MKKLLIILTLSSSFSTFSLANLESIDIEFCYEQDIRGYYENYESFDRSNEQYTGKSTCKYLNGSIISEGSYINGKEEGKWTYWYKNGKIKSERNYKGGQLDGKSNSWNKNGQKLYEKNYKDGK